VQLPDRLARPAAWEWDGPALRDGVVAADATVRVYDDRGAVVSTTDAVGSTTKWTYGPRGELLSLEDPNGNTRRWSYDPATGWLAATTDALGAAVT
jgi:YD repeat-containing protein